MVNPRLTILRSRITTSDERLSVLLTREYPILPLSLNVLVLLYQF